MASNQNGAVDTAPGVASKAGAGRLVSLDSLRGLAALSVVFYHFRRLQEVPLNTHSKILGVTLLQLITAGTEAVVLFFILSGFVLSIPAIRGKPQPYRVFFVRRVFRIYLPYLAALGFAVWGALTFHGGLPLSPWFHKTWSHPVDSGLVWQHIFFWGSFDDAQFNTAFWSVIVEMRVSLFFPVLCALTLKMKPGLSLVFAAGLSALSFLLCFLYPQQQSLFLTFHYTALFVVGIFLARLQKKMSALYATLSRLAKFALAILSLLMFVYGGRLVFRFTSASQLVDWPIALGAAGIMFFGLNSGLFKKILLVRPIQWLGLSSYSMYLMHGTVLFTLVYALYGRIPLLAILPIYLFSVLIVTTCFYFLVEKPTMEWGRRLSNLLVPARKETRGATGVPASALGEMLASVPAEPLTASYSQEARSQSEIAETS